MKVLHRYPLIRQLVKQKKTIMFLLCISFILRFLAAPFLGFSFDLQQYIDWGITFNAHPLDFYTVASIGRPISLLPNYPPLMIYLYGLVAGIYSNIVNLFGGHPIVVVAHSPLLMMWVKLPAILFDLGTVLIIYILASRRFSEHTAGIIAGSYAFSPAIFFDSMIWGQTDSIPLFFILLALLATTNRKAILAGVFLGLAIMLKPQPIIFTPLLLVYLYRWVGWKSVCVFLGSIFVTVCIICLPYLRLPVPEILVFYKNIQLWMQHGYISDNAFNLWWLLKASPLFAVVFSFHFLSPYLIGWTLFLITLIVVIFCVSKDRSSHTFFLGAGIISVAFFVVTTLQHERYMYPAIALTLITFIYTKNNKLFYITATTTTFLNMFLVLTLLELTFFKEKSTLFTSVYEFVYMITLCIALVNIWLLVKMLVTAVKQVRIRQTSIDAADDN